MGKLLTIEDILLEYHRITGKANDYSLVQIHDFRESNTLRSVKINDKHIQFYEDCTDNLKSVIYWRVDPNI